MPRISAFLLNETLHQGLVFICAPPALPSPSLYKSQQLAGLLTKPSRCRAHRHLCAHGCSQLQRQALAPRESPEGSDPCSKDVLLPPASQSLQRQTQQPQQDLDLLKVSEAALPGLRLWGFGFSQTRHFSTGQKPAWKCRAQNHEQRLFPGSTRTGTKVPPACPSACQWVTLSQEETLSLCLSLLSQMLLGITPGTALTSLCPLHHGFLFNLGAFPGSHSEMAKLSSLRD